MDKRPVRRALALALTAVTALGCGDPSEASSLGPGGGTGFSGAAGSVASGGAESDLPSGGQAGADDVDPTGGSAGVTGSAGAAGNPNGGSGGTAGQAGADGSGGAIDGGGGTAATDGSACPTNGPPAGPFALRFDVATLQCSVGGVCTGSEDKCLCLPDFKALAALPGHFLAVASDMNKSTTWSSGNVQAVYVDDLNTDWKLGGAARAAALIAKAKKSFPCGVPKWFIMNEISNGMWPTLAAYRSFVIDFAKTMKTTHGKAVVLAAPFQTVSGNGASWSELQKYAYIGVEAYLSGKEIQDNGFSVAWCQAQYAASAASYMKQGVPKSRLILFEHFGNTGDFLDNGIPIKWGRQSVSAAAWHKAITVRARAAHNVGFAGFVSYDWGANGLHAPESDRLAFMKTYRAQTLP